MSLFPVGFFPWINYFPTTEVLFGDDVPLVQSDDDFMRLRPDPALGAVVCGFDFNLSYSKIAYASLCLQKNPGCLFLATSQDSFDTLTDRRIPAMTGMVKSFSLHCYTNPTLVH